MSKPWGLLRETNKLWNGGLDSTDEFRHEIKCALRRAFKAGVKSAADVAAAPDRCEGCGKWATKRDVEGVPLCGACYDSCLEDGSEAAPTEGETP